MSLHHENFAWPLDMPAMKKLVLIGVYREAKRQTGEMHTHAANLAALLGMSESTVRKFVDELERDGHLVQLKGYGRGLHCRVVIGDKVPA